MSEAEQERFVDECRQVARRLQRDLGSADPVAARSAAVRFARLPQLAERSLEQILAERASLSRSQALDVVAMERSFDSWAALLAACLPLVLRVTMYTPRMSLYLNRWFTNYDEAAASKRDEGGYLLPYRRQFFVTCREAIVELGIDAEDPDWRRIGFDWIRPLDAEAHLRLARARLDSMLARGEELP